MKCTLRDAFDRWNIAETPADDIEDVGMRCSILGRDLLVEVKSLMTASQQGMWNSSPRRGWQQT